MEAYSPLTRGEKFNHPVLRRVAAKYEKSVAQILIRWVLEHEVVVIPKSSHLDRIRENTEIFDFSLEKEDLDELDGLDEDFRVSWNPTNAS